MIVCVIGLGSMGRRRLRLLAAVARERQMDLRLIGVDSQEARQEEARRQFGIRTFGTLAEALREGPACAFVCTSPLSHAGLIRECLENGLHVFTELNLVPDGYEENQALAKKRGKVLFLSSTFLYRAEIGYIRDQVRGAGCPLNYLYHIGQYLPDWHPWESYQNYFVGDRRTNGCREILAIELPWLTDVFGPVTEAETVRGKNSSLRIEYPDNYLITFRHASGAKGVLAVDVVSRKAVRNLEIYGEQLYLAWNGSPGGLFRYDWEKKADENIRLYDQVDRLEGYSAFVIENAYQREIEAFFDQVFRGEEPAYGFARDRETLALIDRIEG